MLRGGVGNHRAVSIDEHAVGERHQEYARDDRDTGLRLDDLESGADGVGRRVLRAGHHAVGQPQVHHERAEVGDIRDRVARLLERDALVGAQPRVLFCESRAQLGGDRVDDGGLGDVEPEVGSACPNHLFHAQDGELHDLAQQQGMSSLQHPIIGALGQHDVLSLTPRPLE